MRRQEQTVDGTVAPTDYEWYQFLRAQGAVEEVNFWRPSAFRSFRAPRFSPFLFKLKAPHNAICGFGYFARYSALPYWLAWDAFGVTNGCPSMEVMLARIQAIRRRMGFRGGAPEDHIGCIVLVSVTLFPEDAWVPQPSDWPARNLTPMRYDLAEGEGRRIWERCKVTAASLNSLQMAKEQSARYGAAITVQPRLGQGAFRVEVTDAYERSCAMTGEHSLPALDAAHIRPYGDDGPHCVSNGLLLRADLHRLFDRHYITVSPDLRIMVSHRLKQDYQNGKSYYPLHGQPLRLPHSTTDRPADEHLRWHNERFK